MLKGKVAIITGAARGIGKAATETFAQNGAIVYATDIRGELLAETAKEIVNKHNAKIIPLTFDVTDVDGQKEAFARIWKEQKRLDILVNNAGVAISALIEMHSKTEIERHFAVNSVAVIEMMQRAVKLMKRNEIADNTRGSIINISSIAERGGPGQIAYSGSKAAVVGITKSSAKELAEYWIRVNAIAPGLTLTPMLEEGLPQKILDDYLKYDVGMHRIGTAQDIANAVLFFASGLSTHVTGQVLSVDGGHII